MYIEQSEGFVLPRNENKVYKLVKSLYILKQAPNQWHEKFEYVFLFSHGFRFNHSDKYIYIIEGDKYIMIICLYVDDMFITSAILKGVIELKCIILLSSK